MVAYLREAASTAELLKRNDVDVVEIHTIARYKGWMGSLLRNSKAIEEINGDASSEKIEDLGPSYGEDRSELIMN